jgi:iron complex transport system substrate-binding protein
MSPGGGSDYFESAVLNPDRVLVDLVKIFHPELLADRSFTYYKNVGR